MATAVSTAGMIVKYCVETTAGTRPTINYTTIPGVKAIPSIFNDPNMLQSTPLSATKNHTYIEGLNDSGGSIQLTVTDVFHHCAGEEVGILQHRAQRAAQVVLADGLDVDTVVDGDGRRGVVDDGGIEALQLFLIIRLSFIHSLSCGFYLVCGFLCGSAYRERTCRTL